MEACTHSGYSRGHHGYPSAHSAARGAREGTTARGPCPLRATPAPGLDYPPTTSAPRLGSPLPTSAPRPAPHLRRDLRHICAGSCHICAGISPRFRSRCMNSKTTRALSPVRSTAPSCTRAVSDRQASACADGMLRRSRRTGQSRRHGAGAACAPTSAGSAMSSLSCALLMAMTCTGSAAGAGPGAHGAHGAHAHTAPAPACTRSQSDAQMRFHNRIESRKHARKQTRTATRAHANTHGATARSAL
jgi:hypothetical protein